MNTSQQNNSILFSTVSIYCHDFECLALRYLPESDVDDVGLVLIPPQSPPSLSLTRSFCVAILSAASIDQLVEKRLKGLCVRAFVCVCWAMT